MSTEPGWYPDPDDPTSQRYYDGTQWTDQRMPAAPSEYGALPPAPQAPASAGNALSIGAIVCGVVAVLFCPIVLGPVGIVLAVLGMRRNESLAKVGLGVAIGGMIVGFILGAVVAASS